LVAWLVEEAERQVVYCAWEDLHWADPSTLEFLTLFLDQIPTTRLLTVLTFRPDFTPPWRPHSHITQLTLNRLGRQPVEVMVEQITGGKPLPLEVVQQIVRKTDGVPLFVEELTKMVLESGLLREEEGRYVGAHGGAPIPPLAIPSTLQDSLMARLDRLATTKELAQVGATLGREFSYELLHAVSPLDEAALQQGLRQLVEAELLYQRGLPPQVTYLFKHALVQDTAYQSLLKSKRQQLHQQIAYVLAERFPETKEAQPELLAHHYTEAGLIEQAIPYWQQAGQRAIERSANVEAIGHLTKGLEVLKALPDTPERTQQELMLQITLGVPLIHLKGYAAPEVERTYTRARELCQQVGETPQLFSALWGLWLFYVCGGGHRETARELGEQLLSLAQSVPDRAPVAHYALGCSLFLLGELAQGREHLERGIALYHPQWHGSYAFLYSQDPRVVCSTYAAWLPWYLGHPDQALKRNNDMLTFAQELSHPFSLAFALNFAAMLHQLRGEVQAAQEWAEAAVALCTEQGFPFWSAPGTILQGWVLAEQGQAEKGIAQMRQGLTSYQATGADLYRPHFLALLAEACGKGRQTEEGLSAVAEALDGVRQTGERYYEAELYRLKGELTLAQSSVQGLASSVQKEAEECFWKAIEIARRQQAKSLELRAVMSLARLWQQQGKRDEARKLLAEIYGWFTEGFDTKDLQEAQALLEELKH
jgi:predicted ATPase